LREISRAARTVPVVRDWVAASDPKRRAARLLASGTIDASLYAAQAGVESMSAHEAATHYAEVGFRLGYTLNVLMDPFVIRRGMIRTNRPVLYDYLNSRAWHARTSGVWSSRRYIEQFPESVDHPSGPVGHLWDRVMADPSTIIEIEPGGAREVAWSQIYPVLRDATVEWAQSRRERRQRYATATLEHPESMGITATSGPLVSIVLPVWNRPAGLRRAIESVRDQHWTSWELVIVDDGSWDDTPTIARLAAERDPRVKVIAGEHRGVCAARNAGIAAASGEYVAFLDSDNTWHPTFLQDTVSTLAEAGADAGYATIALTSESGAAYRHGVPELESLLQGNSIDLNTLVVSRRALDEVGGFDESLRRAVDYDLVLKLARRRPLLHVPTVGASYDNREESSDRISTTEPLGWNTLVRLRHTELPAARERPAGTAFLPLVQRHDPHLSQKIQALAEAAGPHDTVAFAAVGLKPDELRMVRAAAAAHPNMEVRFFQEGEPFAYVVNVMMAHADRATAVVLDPAVRYTADQLISLAGSVDTPGAAAVMPVTLALDGTIAHAGAARQGPRPQYVDLLENHPLEDARAIGDEAEVPALTGRTFAITARLFEEAGGLDPLLFNESELIGLSLRLRRQAAGALRLQTATALPTASPALEFLPSDPVGSRASLSAQASHLGADDVAPFYRPAGMQVAHWRRDTPTDETVTARDHIVPVVVRERRTVRVDGKDVPRLRWAIKTASPAGPKGETWGDTHFARSLAAALGQLGQDAVVDAREAAHRGTDYLDDVTVVLRGLDDITPPPGSLAYLWVLSHPDMVHKSELSRFDRVFAASISWSRKVSSRHGIEVEPLLQCTDPARFTPTDAVRGDDILFVGNSRGIPRPTVMESVRAGIDLTLYGSGWERFVAAEAVTAESVDNRELGGLYGSARVVLNDHWSDMQREGFISNRLFDVVAAGGRVLSDDVAGVDEVFGGAVATFERASDIPLILRSDLESLFPDEKELARLSERVRNEHSFLARARVLLDRALTDWHAGATV
jgi:hypothetical protein